MQKALYMVVEHFRNKDAYPYIVGFEIAAVWRWRACCTCRAGSMKTFRAAIG
jgi:hypothetical protein